MAKITAVVLNDLLLADVDATLKEANLHPLRKKRIPKKVLAYLTKLASKNPEKDVANWFGHKENIT